MLMIAGQQIDVLILAEQLIAEWMIAGLMIAESRLAELIVGCLSAQWWMPSACLFLPVLQIPSSQKWSSV